MGELYDILKASGLRGGAGGGGGSGFTPTQEQLDAMNSGIDSAKVAQIETNKNNILLKANTSDVNTATANLQAQIDLSEKHYDDVITNRNVASILQSDFNNIQSNTLYRIQLTSAVAGLPDNFPYDGLMNFIICYENSVDWTTEHAKHYVIYNRNLSPIFKRDIEDNVDYGWRVITIGNVNVLNKLMYGTALNDIGYDLNNAADNVMYELMIRAADNVSNLPTGYPLEKSCLLFTLRFDYGSTVRKVQYILDRSTFRQLYRRDFDTSWYSWKSVADTNYRRRITVDISGNGNYIKLTDALSNAYNNGNTDIYVQAGTYDITSEIDLATAGSGPLIGNNTRLYFSPDSEVVCEYTGGVDNVERTFSPINAGTGDYEIHDMRIRCKNVRYCVHDERSSNDDYYTHKYINCNMYLDDANAISWKTQQCIGGGLGKHGIIDISGGEYRSTYLSDRGDMGEITYHNSAALDAQSKITISNAYFTNTARFICYGSTTKMTHCNINNCSVSKVPTVYYGDISSVTNMEMVAYNNELRS